MPQDSFQVPLHGIKKDHLWKNNNLWLHVDYDIVPNDSPRFTVYFGIDFKEDFKKRFTTWDNSDRTEAD